MLSYTLFRLIGIMSKFPSQVDFNLSDMQQEWVVGIAVAAAAVGAGYGGFSSNYFGRKPTIILSSVCFTLGSVLLFTAHSFSMLIVGRIVLGLGVGLASMAVPPYIAENSPPAYRLERIGLY